MEDKLRLIFQEPDACEAYQPILSMNNLLESRLSIIKSFKKITGSMLDLLALPMPHSYQTLALVYAVRFQSKSGRSKTPHQLCLKISSSSPRFALTLYEQPLRVIVKNHSEFKE